MGFTVICNKCGKTLDINAQNVAEFFQEYAWGYSDFKINSSTTEIAIFKEYDMSNTTMLCVCGNSVRE